MGDDDIDELEIAREEAHRTIDKQVQTLTDIDNKAARILRINLVLISIILTGVSIGAEVGSGEGGGGTNASVGISGLDTLTNDFIIFSIGCLIISTAMAAVTYTASDIRGGMSGSALNNLVENDKSDKENLKDIVKSYSFYINFNYRTNARNAPLGTLTLLLLIYAITSLALGTTKLVTGTIEGWLIGLAFVLNVVLTLYTRFHRQTWRGIRIWWQTQDDDACIKRLVDAIMRIINKTKSLREKTD